MALSLNTFAAASADYEGVAWKKHFSLAQAFTPVEWGTLSQFSSAPLGAKDASPTPLKGREPKNGVFRVPGVNAWATETCNMKDTKLSASGMYGV